jgi:ADP-dependent NAD(P)H-hydrate dehydratase
MQIIDEIPKLKARPIDGHKGTFGKVLIIGGSVGMSGAAALAGRSALRAGAGLVRIATAKSALPIIASIEPCYTTIALAEDKSGRISSKAITTILDAVGENDAVAFGPGVGISGDLQKITGILLQQQDLRLLIDGDGLNNLSKLGDWTDKLKAKVILTPHPGEMNRLWSGLFREPLPPDRQEQATRFAQHTRTVVALKGAGTVVTDLSAPLKAGRQKIYVNKTGNPGMATAGSGDVLTGVIIALMGQGLSDFDAAVLGVYVHGLAGDIAAEKLGQISVIATDIIDSLSNAFMKI